MCRTEKATADRKCAALAAADVRNSHPLSVFFYSQDKNVFDKKLRVGLRLAAELVHMLLQCFVLIRSSFM